YQQGTAARVSSPAATAVLLLCHTPGAPDYDGGTGAKTSGFRVDEASVIHGRHSTTFSLSLDCCLLRLLPYTDPARRAGERADCAAASADITTTSIDAGSATCTSAILLDLSVFFKRVTCAELPPRSLKKW
ncbi:unnamed protein product, partial [Pylaiella littoralis]